MTVYQKAEDFCEKGLTQNEAEVSRKEHGDNLLTRRRQKSFLRQFLQNLNDPIIRILLCALAVNLLLVFRHADWVETAGIAVAVFLATLISTLSERSSERAFSELSEQSTQLFCRVRRGGEICRLPIGEVVVGDVVLLSAGEMIPADGLLLRGGLLADQSAMTGENREISKFPSDDREMDPAARSSLFRGCTVTSGGGEMGVMAVGDASFLGQISHEVQMEQRDSPLKQRLAKLAKQISMLGYLAAGFVALAYLIHVFWLDSGMNQALILLKLQDLPYLFEKLFHAFTLGLTVIVVAVPEGLPMMIAVVLSGNIRRMVKDQVLVRKPVGIEAAGSMNLLFTDKTGTLTDGKMKVSAVQLADGSSYATPSELEHRGSERICTLLSLALHGGEAVLDKRKQALGGNATDRALLNYISGISLPQGYRRTSKLAFSSERKYAGVTYAGKESLSFLLGAPEKLLPFAQKAVLPNGELGYFSSKEVKANIKHMTEQGKRCVAVAISAEGIPSERFSERIQGSLILLCVVCLSDPIRREAPRAVSDLHGAGVGVVMVTGDSRETAASIARGCGILCDRRDAVLSGGELAKLTDAQVKKLLPRLAVVCRALPTDKSRLVRLAQEEGCVVGMTGDGINDAPALRRADIGFAMGDGTQVAKDAGDIVILDNNLASIVRAVLYGRSIFKSIRKFITLQLTMNFSAVGVTMICPFLGIDSPVTVVQMLWINLIMDTLGGLAFAGETPLPEYLTEPPKRQEEGILNRYMVNQILCLGGFTIALCLFFLKSPLITVHFRASEDRIYLLTAFFALFIFSSVFNCFNARTDRIRLTAGLKGNPIFLLIMLAVLAIQLLFVYLGGSVLRTAPLQAGELLLTMLLSLSVFPFDLVRKSVWRLLHGERRY